MLRFYKALAYKNAGKLKVARENFDTLAAFVASGHLAAIDNIHAIA